MANVSSVCLFPFVDQADFPPIGGYIEGRFCASVAAFNYTSCCLPCPLQDYVYSDDFGMSVDAAFWVSLPSFILQILLMITFIVLPEKDGHGHYLNWGLVVGVALLELCLIVPEAAKPEYCFDAITPNDMSTSIACAWSGSLLLAGAMASISWILVRSLFTHLRVVWSMELPRWYPIVSHIIGWGLPALFLSISLPITGVSFQVGPLCLPKKHLTFITWFGWYLAFSSLAALIQISTTIFCIAVYLASLRDTQARQSLTTSSSAGEVDPRSAPSPTIVSGMYASRPAWKQVKKVLVLQWRSILLSLLVVVEAIYFGVIYVMLSNTAQQQLSEAGGSPAILAWGSCLVTNNGDKNACLGLAADLGLKQGSAVASFVMLAVIGIFTFLLMVRRSMFVGWYHIIREPKKYLGKVWRRNSSVEEDFVLVSNKNAARDVETGASSVKPEPGNVSERHETTNMFEDSDDDEGGMHDKEIERV